MRRAHHGDVVADRRRVFGQAQRLGRRLDPGSGNQDFVIRCRLAGDFKYFATLFVGKQDGFAGRALHDDSRNGSFRIALDIGFELFVVDIAVGIKRGGYGRKDSLEKHGSSPQMSAISLPAKTESFTPKRARYKFAAITHFTGAAPASNRGSRSECKSRCCQCGCRPTPVLQDPRAQCWRPVRRAEPGSWIPGTGRR